MQLRAQRSNTTIQMIYISFFDFTMINLEPYMIQSMVNLEP